MTQKIGALVIGAGVAGLYQLHQLREMGMNAHGVEAGTDVGGTWYWNRYPGAKFDSESYIYQYLFDEKLYKDWTWSERFPAQPEIERWMHYVTDRLDLRKDITFASKVTKAVYDEVTGRWTVETDNGDTYDTQFLIGCTGIVRRQGFWDRRRPELREGLAHLVVLIMRPICGEASAGFRWSFV